MSSSLLALLSQQTPIQTRRGLILTGLQNDFLSPDGKLPVSIPDGFYDRLKVLVEEFREHGDVIWVRSHFQENRAVNLDDETGDAVIIGPPTVKAASPGRPAELPRPDDEFDSDPPSPSKKRRLSGNNNEPTSPESDEDLSASGSNPASIDDPELFLTRTANREPCCIPGTSGAEYPAQVEALIDKRRDLQLNKTYYSAFASTSLLLTLRTKLVTELYICGCTTNLSAFATAMDAARHGISINLVEDCLGYRSKDRHDAAIERLRDVMAARVMTSDQAIERLRNPQPLVEDESSEDEDDSDVHAVQDQRLQPSELLAVDSDEESDEDSEGKSSLVGLANLMASRIRTLAVDEKSSLRRAAAHEPIESTRTTVAQPSSAVPGAGGQVQSAGGAGRRAEEQLFGGWIGRATASGRGIAGDSKGRVIPPAEGDIENTVRKTSRSSQTSIPTMPTDSRSNWHGDSDGEQRLHRVRRPLFGPDKETESSGSSILFDFLPPELAASIFDTLNEEIEWQKMHHQTGEVPRLVCCQGTISDEGSMPVYRHPSDQTLPIERWSPTVNTIREAAEEVVGHQLNHALIQLYRSGNDFISEHSDKTLDIAPGSYIVNVSFGAQRTMRLRTKRNAVPTVSTHTLSPGRTTYRVPMPHNSMITMSLPTNAEYLHGITADKRPRCELSDEELAFGGQRISITFRHIATYLSADSSKIWGRGAKAKAKEDAHVVINADTVESEKLVRAFGLENQASSIEWEEIYGEGSDVLHLR